MKKFSSTLALAAAFPLTSSLSATAPIIKTIRTFICSIAACLVLTSCDYKYSFGEIGDAIHVGRGSVSVIPHSPYGVYTNGIQSNHVEDHFYSIPPKYGIELKRSGNHYIYPQDRGYYGPYTFYVKPIVKWDEGEDNAILHLAIDIDIDCGKIEEETQEVTTPKKSRKHKVWIFEGEHKIEQRLRSTPKNKDLYLAYRVEFCPTSDEKCHTKYWYKERKREQ